MKVEQSLRTISPFAGLYFIDDAANELKISTVINGSLPSRSINAQYRYSDVVLSLFSNCLLQGSRLSDLEMVKHKLPAGKGFKIPSPDTVEYACQELKPATCVYTERNQKGKLVDHQSCFQPAMNALLAKLAIKTGQLKVGAQGYTLDFDHMVVENEKQDARLSYKMVKGYHPCMAAIGRLPVYIENHNGNTPARFEQKESLERCFQTLQSQGIEIENFRADSASYQQEVIELVASKSRFFYIRMMDFQSLREKYSQVAESEWNTVRIGLEEVEVASLFYRPANSEKTYRLVATRKLKADRQIELETGSAYRYQAIITNQMEWTEQHVIQFYNQRGDAENTNRYMLNDFNVNNLPFMDMSTNTVYMYLMGYAAILFEWSKALLLKNKVVGIKACMRVKAVCLHYITIAGEWIAKKGEQILIIYSPIPYQPLQI